ncbi:MAG: hypothetical protein EOP48_03520 [Sphingobacteriales bacterium]|nr:MAG: hypothetical protein EOP48_03520 [Sphingobacteriales bacterium]
MNQQMATVNPTKLKITHQNSKLKNRHLIRIDFKPDQIADKTSCILVFESSIKLNHKRLEKIIHNSYQELVEVEYGQTLWWFRGLVASYFTERVEVRLAVLDEEDKIICVY